MVLHKSLGGDTRRNTVGPTLEQCLVLPPGVALKVDGLLSQQPLLSKLGAEDGGRDGGGGDGLDQVASKEGVGGSLQAGRGEGGLHAGDDRAIISTYTFEVRVGSVGVDSMYDPFTPGHGVLHTLR